MTQRKIPCLLMRGGTSRGPFFEPGDLPANPAIRDRVLLAVMGSPDMRQIDGLGGATTLTSKVAVVGRSERHGIDVDYLFAQVSIDRAVVDTRPSCGNMLAGVGPFAIERGLVTPRGDETRVTVFNVNTHSRIESVIQTPGGKITYEGNQRIDGVPGTAAPIPLNFYDVVGSKCDALLPTGIPQEEIDGIAVTCIDVAMPMVMMRSVDLEAAGYVAGTIPGNSELMQRIEKIRLEAGRRMGLGDVTDSVIPKVGILARASKGGVIASRYLTPHDLHAAHAVTGAICVASCASIEGTVAETLTRPGLESSETVRIEHPSGLIDIELETSGTGVKMTVLRAAVVRTARKIMDGQLFVSASVWPATE